MFCCGEKRKYKFLKMNYMIILSKMYGMSRKGNVTRLEKLLFI